MKPTTAIFGTIGLGFILIILSYWLFFPVSGTYKIKKGNHYSGWRFKFFFKQSDINLKVKFYDSCWYDIHHWGNHINKLYGIGDFNIHKNSDRIGWRPNEKVGYIDLFFYDYRDGKRFIAKRTFIKTLKYHEIHLITPEYKFGRHSFFYYGGKPTAPNDMVCDIVFL